MRVVLFSLVSVVLSAHGALALSDTERKALIDEAKGGEIAGGAYRLQVKPEYAGRLSKSLYVEHIGDRVFINRNLDPNWQHCMGVAGATWMANLLARQDDGGGSMVEAAIDLTDLPKVADCNREWHETLYQAAVDYRFEALEAHVETGDQNVMEYVNQIFDNISTDVIDLEKDGKKIKGDISDLKSGVDNINSQMSQLTADHNKLAKLIIDANQKRVEADKVSAQHDQIAAGVVTVQLLSRVVLKNSPDTQYKINTGAKSIGAIADAVTDLGRNGLSAAQKVILSGNIANAALAIVGLFGPGAQDPTVTLLQAGFAAVRQDIHELETEMNTRFDEVERALDTIYSSMQTRFDEITDRLDIMNQKLESLSAHQKQAYQLSISAFRALLQHDYKAQIQYCRDADAPNYLQHGDFAKCLQTVAQYGTDDAANDVFTGAIFFDPDWKPEQATDTIDNLDPDYQRGYLATSLKQLSASMGTVGAGAVEQALPSPMGWSGAVDTYFSIRALAPKLKKAGPIDLNLLTKASLIKLQETGEKIILGVAAIRQYGPPVAADIYIRDVKLAAKPLADAVIDHLSESDLGLFKVGDYRCFTHIFYNNGNDIDFDLFRGTALYLKTGTAPEPTIKIDGCDANENFITKLSIQHRHVHPGLQANAGNVGGLAKSMAAALYDDTNFGLKTYDRAVVTPDKDVKSAKKSASAAFLAKENMTAWSPEALASLSAAFQGYSGSEKLTSACQKMAESKGYFENLTTLYRSNVDLKKDWAADLAALPSGIGVDNICGDLAEFAIQEHQPVAKNALGASVVEEFIGGEVNARLIKFRVEYANAPMNDPLPEIELRQQRIGRCLKNITAPICP